MELEQLSSEELNKLKLIIEANVNTKIMLKTKKEITLNIEDDFLQTFFEKLSAFMKENNIEENSILINGKQISSFIGEN